MQLAQAPQVRQQHSPGGRGRAGTGPRAAPLAQGPREPRGRDPGEAGGRSERQPAVKHAITGAFPTFGGSIVFRIILPLLAQVTAKAIDGGERVK